MEYAKATIEQAARSKHGANLHTKREGLRKRREKKAAAKSSQEVRRLLVCPSPVHAVVLVFCAVISVRCMMLS